MSELKTYEVSIDYYGNVSDTVEAESEDEAIEMIATDVPWEADGYTTFVNEI